MIGALARFEAGLLILQTPQTLPLLLPITPLLTFTLWPVPLFRKKVLDGSAYGLSPSCPPPGSGKWLRHLNAPKRNDPTIFYNTQTIKNSPQTSM